MSDLISRQAAIDAVYKCSDIFAGDMPVMVVKADAYEALAQLPSAKPERKKGKWIKKKSMIYCSQCACSFDSIFTNDFDYCPRCGADMRNEVTK